MAYYCMERRGTEAPGYGAVCVCDHRSGCHDGGQRCHVDGCGCLAFVYVVCGVELRATGSLCKDSGLSDYACNEPIEVHCDAPDPDALHMCSGLMVHHPFRPGLEHITAPAWRHAPRRVSYTPD